MSRSKTFGRRRFVNRLAAVATATLALGGSVLAGCGGDAPPGTAKPTGEVRGAPLISPTPTASEHPASGAPAAAELASAPPKGAEPESKAPPSVPDAGGTAKVTIGFLSSYRLSSSRGGFGGRGGSRISDPPSEGVPEKIRALSGRRVSIDGYLMPIDFAEGSCTHFVLTNCPPGCCFGCSMLPNNWIDVTMASGKTANCSNTSRLVRVEGVLHVHGTPGEEDSPIYTMDGESVGGT